MLCLWKNYFILLRECNCRVIIYYLLTNYVNSEKLCIFIIIMNRIKPYEALSAQLEEVNILSDIEIEQICSCFKTETILKNHYYLEAEKRCSKIGFLTDGIICSFIYNSEGSEVVKHFLEPYQFFTDLDSYEKAKPAKLNLIAVTDSTILSISKQENDKLQDAFPKWKHVQGLFASQALNKMIQMQNFLHFGSATDKYQHFVKNYPNLARNVPLKYIASYLGITQSSLSRLRRENI